MKKAIGSSLVIFTSLITLLTPSLALASQSTDSINAGMPTNVSEMNLKILGDRGGISPYSTFYGDGGISVITHTGRGNIYWAVQPTFSYAYNFNGSLLCINNKTNHIQTKVLSGRKVGRLDGNVSFNVSKGNSYTVKLTGLAAADDGRTYAIVVDDAEITMFF